MPEKTFPALFAALEEGYGIIELDVGVTKDTEFVLLHDKTLNRTARRADGSALEDEVKLCEVTYEEALQYDFGIWFAKKFKGVKIPRFADVLEFALENGIKLKIDNKYEAFSSEEKAAFYKLLAPFESVASLTCKSAGAIKEAAEIFKDMHFHYDGKVTEEILAELSEILPKERLTVWLPLKNKLTAWVKTDFATRELADVIKKHARLGVWILSSNKELREAQALGAEVVETNGSLKPRGACGVFADMHTHSEHSHDSTCPIEEMIKSQRERGINVFAVTDHFDTSANEVYDIFTPIKRACEEADELRKKNPDMKILRGVEIGESFWQEGVAEEIICAVDFDVIIGSVHLVRHEGLRQAYSGIDFGAMTDEEIYAYLDTYFEDVLTLLDYADFDILAHLSCPLRYIVGKYGRKIELSRYSERIDQILKLTIKSGKALEVNTSSFDTLGDFMPGREIIKRYKDMGGYLITLGSDAHVSKNAAVHFEEAKSELREMGFEHVYYYEKRKPFAIKI